MRVSVMVAIGLVIGLVVSLIRGSLSLAAEEATRPMTESQQPATVSAPQKDEQGVLTYRVESTLQSAATDVRVLLPDDFDESGHYRVLYVLPVEAGRGDKYGDGLSEVRKLGLHNRRQLICVAPSFADLPWYADHPTNARLQQEAYFLNVVLPLVESKYPVIKKPAGRLLLGFSKSGWGAWSLLLRRPDLFGRAAAWDSPMTMTWPSSYGSQPIFATADNFERYRILTLADEVDRHKLGQDERLGLFGYGSFRGQHESAHAKLVEFKVPHHYVDGPHRPHTWGSGWVEELALWLSEESK